ncbi:MAG: urocanate hydratase [Saprospiraceae bacterium]|nr:urocanate hydratase [Saprospiraceae bacterium]
MNHKNIQEEIKEGIPQILPHSKIPTHGIPHAPKRNISNLTDEEKKLALQNALRYFEPELHEALATEFYNELENYGRIYMYRFMPRLPVKAYNIDDYPCKSKKAAAIMLMIQNNLDPLVAKYPEELITYGGNGAVFQNWAQYRLTMRYLSEMTDNQTLVLYSGHPMGLFPSHENAPRVVVTNGMMIPNYSSKEDWNKYNALGVTQYGQMTAGSFMYIGPQGIVHGTTITLMNAGRMRKLGEENLKGKLFITSGLGGMSGAQAIASIITGAVCILAEVDNDAIQQRINDGYIHKENIFTQPDKIFASAASHQSSGNAICLVYYGNIIDIWEYAAKSSIHVDLGSDQTSLHNIDDLGYCPAGFTFEEAKQLLLKDKKRFDDEVKSSLRRHVKAINILSDQGMYFWDYGNAFLLEAGKAGADIFKNTDKNEYKYPSYVQDIMGPFCFDYGFGPFRWVCTSGSTEDLLLTDKIAAQVLLELINESSGNQLAQYKDNLQWIQNATTNLPIVGSKSRILYADTYGRIKIASAFNRAIHEGKIKAPIVLGRDHHDVSGTDSPYRETSNIYDGSKFTADMAIQNVIGDSFRGATWVSIHNGGGVGWGEVINGGFGLVIDGSKKAEENLQSMLHWDVANGIARRSWARNDGAIQTIKQLMSQDSSLQITIPNKVDEKILNNLYRQP